MAARDTAKAFGETYAITQGRAREGVASDLEVRQAQTSYDQARSDMKWLFRFASSQKNSACVATWLGGFIAAFAVTLIIILIVDKIFR